MGEQGNRKNIPSIAIVTINKNNLDGLRRTVESIRTQSHRPNEHFIVDGTSVDGSLGYIAYERRQGTINHLIDKGQGIYEAMNIGLKKCLSEYIIFLNSGDYFFNKNSLRQLAVKALNNEIIYGCIAIKIDHADFLIKRPAKEIHYDTKYQHDLPFFPACLIKTKLLINQGCFREDMRISSDVDMLSKLALRKCKFKYVNKPITIFDETGISSKNTLQAFTERLRILLKIKKSYIFAFIRIMLLSQIQKLTSKS